MYDIDIIERLDHQSVQDLERMRWDGIRHFWCPTHGCAKCQYEKEQFSYQVDGPQKPRRRGGKKHRRNACHRSSKHWKKWYKDYKIARQSFEATRSKLLTM